MIDSLEELAEILRETELSDRELAQTEILNTGERALAVEVAPSDCIASWEVLRRLVPRTGRWPVVVSSWEESDRLEAIFTDLFSRFPYDFEPERGNRDISPRAIVARAEDLSVEVALQSYADVEAQFTLAGEELRAEIESELQYIRDRFGMAPSRSEVMEALGDGAIAPHRLESFLFAWETERIPPAQLETPPPLGYLDWFEPDGLNTGIILLPTLKSWETLAYASFFGAEGFGEAEKAIAVLKSWNQRFGAELVAHYGTMLQFVVRDVPSTPQDAFQLAWEQSLLASCTLLLPGISLREHARALRHTRRWFLHERP